MKTIEISSTTDLQNAIAAGFTPEQMRIVMPDADAVHAEATSKATATAEEAITAARAQFDAERVAWDAERARLLDGAVAMSLPEQTASIRAAERDRIFAIHSLVRPGFEAIANKAIHDGLSPADFALAMMTEEADRGITLDAIRRDAPPPAPHASAPSTEAKPGTKLPAAADVYAAHNAARAAHNAARR
jgi:acyl dehydratase